jgi:DNA invertase Pin-like site-specific DNA recombinase
MALRAAIFARVSDEDHQGDNFSIPSQLAECRAYCESEDLDVVREYVELFSAEWAEDMPQHQSMLAAARRGEFDVLVTLKYDRLARHHFDIGHALRVCERHGVKVVFVKDAAPEGEYGDLFAFMKGFAGYNWRKGIIESAGRGQRAKITGAPENGIDPRPLGSARPPYGLRYVEEYEMRGGVRRPAKRRFEPHPEEAPIVRMIFDWYDSGLTLRDICRRLEARGIISETMKRTGRTKWYPVVVRRLLLNPNYIGIGYAGQWDRSKDRGRRSNKMRPPEEWVRLPDGTYPVLIDQSVWRRVQDRFEINRRESVRSDRNPEFGILRRGIGKCGYCGGNLQVHYVKGKAHYTCRGDQRFLKGCPSSTMLQTKLDDEVWALITALLERPELLAEKLFGAEHEQAAEVSTRLVEKRIAELERQRATLRRRIAMEEDDELADELRAELKVVIAEMRASEAELAAIEAQRTAWESAQERRRSVIDHAQAIRNDLGDMSWREKRQALIKLGVTVELYTAKHDPRWRLTTRWQPTGKPHAWVMHEITSDGRGKEEISYLDGQEIRLGSDGEELVVLGELSGMDFGEGRVITAQNGGNLLRRSRRPSCPSR